MEDTVGRPAVTGPRNVLAWVLGIMALELVLDAVFIYTGPYHAIDFKVWRATA